jgi:hypothetical protein
MNAYRTRAARGAGNRVRGTVALLCAMVSVAMAADKKPPPVKPANQYAAFDAHDKEHVTIAVEPCDDEKECSFFRLPYVAHSMLPVRVIITNDGDRPLSLDDARMQFLSANNDKIPAASYDDLNRRLFSMHDVQGTKIPLIPLTIHHAPVDKKILQDDADFGFKSSTVPPHTTVAGYLFYDFKDLDDPALRHAEFYVKMLHLVGSKEDLFAFTIPFDEWLAANPDAPSNKVRN